MKNSGLHLLKDLGPHDVLMGRGTGPNEHIGNVRYRALVKEVMETTDLRTWNSTTKRMLAVKVVNTVKAKGGKFVEKVTRVHPTGSTKKSHGDVYAEVPDSKAYSKAKQCFRHHAEKKETTKKPAEAVVIFAAAGRDENPPAASCSLLKQEPSEQRASQMPVQTSSCPSSVGKLSGSRPSSRPLVLGIGGITDPEDAALKEHQQQGDGGVTTSTTSSSSTPPLKRKEQQQHHADTYYAAVRTSSTNKSIMDEQAACESPRGVSSDSAAAAIEEILLQRERAFFFSSSVAAQQQEAAKWALAQERAALMASQSPFLAKLNFTAGLLPAPSSSLLLLSSLAKPPPPAAASLPGVVMPTCSVAPAATTPPTMPLVDAALLRQVLFRGGTVAAPPLLLGEQAVRSPQHP